MKIVKLLCVPIFVIAVVLMPMVCQYPGVNASYAGDSSIATHLHGRLHGGVIFGLGDSVYRGNVIYNDSYTVDFNVALPGGAKVKHARLYTYWCWSKNNTIGTIPETDTTLMDISSNEIHQLESDRVYTDRKGFVGWYDFLSGTFCYDVSPFLSHDGKYSVSVRNDARDAVFSIYGSGLVIVYESDEAPLIEYWLNEGADMLYAGYGITSTEATGTIPFDGELDTDHVTKATLTTIVPSAGYCPRGVWEDIYVGHTSLHFNSGGWLSNAPAVIKDGIKYFIDHREGKTWEDVYVANRTVQIGVDERDVTRYLKKEGNAAKVRDNGDYMMLTNGILIVEYSDTPVNDLYYDNLPCFSVSVITIVIICWLVIRKRPTMKVSVHRDNGNNKDNENNKNNENNEKNMKIGVLLRSGRNITGNIAIRGEGIEIPDTPILVGNFKGKRRYIREVTAKGPGKYRVETTLSYARDGGKERTVVRRLNVVVDHPHLEI